MENTVGNTSVWWISINEWSFAA